MPGAGDRAGLAPEEARALAALRELPRVAAIAAALEPLVEDGRIAGAWLVGGLVRDALLGTLEPVDIDLAVDGDTPAAATAVHRALDGEVTHHDRFGTATVDVPDDTRVDIAATRRERYAAPGALPDVVPASIHEDLLRRDFTVNAMAVAITGPRAGELVDPVGGLEDLRARRLAILHPASFLDDPTRVLRLVRYGARLKFDVEPETTKAAADPRVADLVAGLTPARIGHEVRLICGEPAAGEALRRLRALADSVWRSDRDFRGKISTRGPGAGIADAVVGGFGARPGLVDDVTLALEGAWANAAIPWRTRLAAALPPGADDRVARRLDLTHGDARAVLAAVDRAPDLVEQLSAVDLTLGAVDRLTAALPAEALVLAHAMSPPAQAARARIERALGTDRARRLAVTGDDLLALGMQPGPAVGAALGELRARMLDGELPDEAAQRAAAERLAALHR